MEGKGNFSSYYENNNIFETENTNVVWLFE